MVSPPDSAANCPDRSVVFLTDGEIDWYGDNYLVERTRWEPLGISMSCAGCTTDMEVLEAAREAGVIVSISVRVPLAAGVIGGLARCRGIVRAGVGVDNVDLEAATARGIVVTNVPTYCTADVADHAVALMLSLARRVTFLDRFVRGGGWQYSVQFTGPVHRLSSLVLGLVGLGQVGRQVARKMSPLVKTILAHDPYVDQDIGDEYGVQLATLEAVLQRSDLISLHLPLLDSTRHLIGADELSLVKPGAVLVNTGRGAVLDEFALAQALQEGRLAGAGLDVLENEPLTSDNPLYRLENVILTPHFAGYSEEAKGDLRATVAQSAADLVEGFWPAHVVNPQVQPRFPLNIRDQILEL